MQCSCGGREGPSLISRWLFRLVKTVPSPQCILGQMLKREQKQMKAELQTTRITETTHPLALPEAAVPAHGTAEDGRGGDRGNAGAGRKGRSPASLLGLEAP